MNNNEPGVTKELKAFLEWRLYVVKLNIKGLDLLQLALCRRKMV